MSVIVKRNGIQVKSSKFETAGVLSRDFRVYADTVYPYKYNLQVDDEKAFSFSVGTGYEKEHNGYDGFKNLRALLDSSETAPTTATSGWCPHLTSLYFIYHEVEDGVVKVVEYDTVSNTISSYFVEGSSAVEEASLPLNNSCAVYGGYLYFIANLANKNGRLIKFSLSGKMVESYYDFNTDISGYDTVLLKNLKIASDGTFAISGDVRDSTEANKNRCFLYVSSLADIDDVTVSGNTKNVLLLNDASTNINARSCVLISDIGGSGKAYATMFCDNTILSSTLSFTCSVVFDDASDLVDSVVFSMTPNFRSVDQAKELPRTNKAIVVASSQYDNKVVAFEYAKCGVCNSAERVNQKNKLGSSIYGYTFYIEISGVQSIAINDTLFSLSAYGTDVFLVKHTGTNIEVYMYDDITSSLVLAAYSSSAASIIQAGTLTSYRLRIERASGSWYITANGVSCDVGQGDGSQLKIISGDQVNFPTHDGLFRSAFDKFTLIIDGKILHDGVPGPEALVGGVSEGMSVGYAFITDDTHKTETGIVMAQRPAFDIIDNGNKNIRVYISTNIIGNTSVSLFSIDCTARTTSYVAEGILFGATPAFIPRVYAPVVVYDSIGTPFIYSAVKVSSESDFESIAFGVCKSDSLLSFECNASTLLIQFDATDPSVTPGEPQTDILYFSDYYTWLEESDEFNLIGYAYIQDTLPTPPYPLIICNENSHVDFLRYGETTEDIPYYSIYRGQTGVTRYDYDVSTNSFYEDANGRFVLGTMTKKVQDTYDNFDAYVETPNLTISQVLEEIKSEVIEAFLKVGVSEVRAEVSWTSDTNYRTNSEKEYLLCGSPEETARLDDGTGLPVYFAGSKQIEIKTTSIDQRVSRSFRLRIEARITDLDNNAYYDDFRVFHVTIKSDPAIAIEGDRDGEGG